MKKIYLNIIRKKRSNKGFTLLEMIVASSIFITVMLIIVGALVSLTNESRKARSVRLVSDNLSAAIDSMSRNMRMGSYYHCGCTGPFHTPQDCPMTDDLGNGGAQCFAFESQFGDPANTNDQYVYRFDNHRIQRSKDSGSTFVDLTAPEISINDMHFYVIGSSVDTHQPVVTLVMKGTATVTPKISTDFNIQTTLGSRTPNYSH